MAKHVMRVTVRTEEEIKNKNTLSVSLTLASVRNTLAAFLEDCTLIYTSILFNYLLPSDSRGDPSSGSGGK